MHFSNSSFIDIRFKNQGLDLIEVQDNGSGIASTEYASVALKHHTSKLSSYTDLNSLRTFGFRGEALASLCSLSTLSIVTCLDLEAPKGSRLSFESSGKLKDVTVVAAQRGTIVSVDKLFYNLPVRRRELERNIKKEWHKVTALLNQYACIQTDVKMSAWQQPNRGARILLFSTKGNRTTRDNIVNIFGAKIMSSLIPLDLTLEMQSSASCSGLNNTIAQSTTLSIVRVVGHISRPASGEGRQVPDRQMFFVNGRPCALPQLSKTFNELYRSYNQSQSPFILADIRLDTHMYDVNVSPDKRSILLHNQGRLLDNLRTALTALFNSQGYTVPFSQQQPTNMRSLAIDGFTTALPTSQVDAGYVRPSQETAVNNPAPSGKTASHADSGLNKVMATEQRQMMLDARRNLPLAKESEARFPVAASNESVVCQISDDNNFHSLSKSSETCAFSDEAVNPKFEDLEYPRGQATPGYEARKHPPFSLLQSEFGSEENSSSKSTKSNSANSYSADTPPNEDSPGDGSHSVTSFPKETRSVFDELKTDSIADQHEDEFLSTRYTRTGNTSTDISHSMQDTELDSRTGIYDRVSAGNLLKTVQNLNSSPNVSRTPSPDVITRNSNNLSTRIVQRLRIDEDSLRFQMDYLNSRQVFTSPRSAPNHVEDIDAPDAGAKLSLIISKSDFLRMRVVGQFNMGFVIAVRPAARRGEAENSEHDELLIIDQHASDEKYNFEKLREETIIQSQSLVHPKRLQLTAMEEDIMMENSPAIEANGFKIQMDSTGDWPAGSRCQVLALPLSRDTTFNLGDLEELIAMLRENSTESRHIPRPSKVRRMFAMRACRSSIMIGKPLSIHQMYTLLRHMGTLDKPWNCPHGRPTMRHLFRLQGCEERCWQGDVLGSTPSIWSAYRAYGG